MTISWIATGYESNKPDNWVCPPERQAASHQIYVRAKRPFSETDNSKTVLSVEVPDPPCMWPITQDARITIKGEVQGVAGDQTFFDEIIPVSVFWFPLLMTILVLAIIYPGCAVMVWLMRTRLYRKEARDAQRKGDPLPEPPPTLLATLDPVQITANEYGRGSLAKLQIFLFSLIVFGILLFYQVRCGLLAGLSNDVMLLMGISAAGAAGGKIVYATKQRLTMENWAWLRRRRWLPEGAEIVPRAKWSELFVDADTKEFDPYSFQMAIFSVVVAVALIRTNLSGLGAFTIPAQLLQLLGLSQVVFVGGKAIERSAYNQLEEKLNEVRDHERAYRTLVAQKKAPSQGEAAPAAGGTDQSATGVKDPEVERQAFKAAAALAAEMFWATYGDRIGKLPPALENIDKLEPDLS